MFDGPGIAQFLGALAEIARGANEPSINPVWCRELLNARDAHRITCTHHEYMEVDDDAETNTIEEAMAHSSFFFGPDKIKAIRRLISQCHRQYTTFETLTAFHWYCRTISLELKPGKDVRLMFISNVRGKTDPPLLPRGYYGNGFVYPAAVTTASKLSRNPLGYARVCQRGERRGSGRVYTVRSRSYGDQRIRLRFTPVRSWVVSNLIRSGLRDVDFGWGKEIFGGPEAAGAG